VKFYHENSRTDGRITRKANGGDKAVTDVVYHYAKTFKRSRAVSTITSTGTFAPPNQWLDFFKKRILFYNYMNKYAILLSWDDEASVWTAVNNEIPIALESDSLDLLIERVKKAAPELLELNKNNHTNITLHFTMEHEKVVA